ERGQILTRLLRRALRHARGIGTHVRDESRGAVGAELHALVQPLRDAHGYLGAEADPLGRFLLERARGERRRRILAPLAAAHIGDSEGPVGDLDGSQTAIGIRVADGNVAAEDPGEDVACLRRTRDLGFLAINLMQPRYEAL